MRTNTAGVVRMISRQFLELLRSQFAPTLFQECIGNLLANHGPAMAEPVLSLEPAHIPTDKMVRVRYGPVDLKEVVRSRLGLGTDSNDFA